MINDRELTDFCWRVFQHGHFGWWWTNKRGRVSAKAYTTEEEARNSMKATRDYED